MATQKEFTVQIFDQDGTTFLKSIPSALLKSPPTFQSKINGGLGECVLDLNLPFDDFDEGVSINYMNITDVYAVDADNPRGRRIYRGFISRYEPYLDSTGNEGVRVTLLGLVSLLSFSHYMDGSSFTVTHSTNDPETIGRAVVDHFGTIYDGSLVAYSDDTTDPVGTNVSITFTDQKWFDAIKKTGELAGEGWWWKIDENGLYWLKAKPSTATHLFTIGGTIDSLRITKDSEKVANDVYVRRSGGTETHYADATSQSTYGTGNPATGRRTKIVSASELTDVNAADQRGNKELADNKDAKVAVQFAVNAKYDLESIKVGETCSILNVTKGSTLFNANMLIVALTYNGSVVSVEVEQQSSNFGLELQNFIAAA